MRLFLSSLDLLGFLALSISAGLASSVVSLSRWIMSAFLTQLSKLVRALRSLKMKHMEFMTASKNGTKWYRLRVGSWSLMIGRKESDS